jgi:hypothetical protein
MQNYTEINLEKLLIIKGKDVVFDVDRVPMCPIPGRMLYSKCIRETTQTLM